VSVWFDKFRVAKASFDPQTIEGGTATIELDLASLRSGSSERDDDLKSPTYIDVGKEQNDDSIRIKGEHTFSRLDFSVGTDPATDPQQQVDAELTIQIVVTIKRS
jgi:polyisoprenoid-binding protein YceI